MVDLLVVGAGVVGLTAALAFRARHPTARVAVLDKERALGAHASGRNSGVLHAGFYYAEDSLKARFARDGCARWKAWCDERGLPVNRCGKLVVARSEDDHPALDELLRRARLHGVELADVDEDEARRIEPRAVTAGRALYSPSTASVDPHAVMQALGREALQSGIDLRLATAFRGWRDGAVLTDGGPIPAGFVLNAAGLQADRVARAFGPCEYRILPFKGLYLRGDVPPGWLGTHVYPVPEVGMPFLGVHFTVTVDGGVTIGPTALPALWREQYGGLAGFSAPELVDVAGRELRLLGDPAFRRLARHELGKLSRRGLLAHAAPLVRGLDPTRFRTWGRPGIRAQLARDGRLVQDFVLEEGDRSLHVLNAVSPAFTCALPFADHLAARIG